MSKIFMLTSRDFVKGLVMAVLGAIILPISIAIQSPDFSIFTANWVQLLSVGANGAFLAFVSYIVKNFFTSSDGKVFGRI